MKNTLNHTLKTSNEKKPNPDHQAIKPSCQTGSAGDTAFAEAGCHCDNSADADADTSACTGRDSQFAAGPAPDSGHGTGASRGRIKSRLGLVLIIAGILVMLVPAFGRLYVNWQQARLYDAYMAELAAQAEGLNQSFAAEEGKGEGKSDAEGAATDAEGQKAGGGALGGLGADVMGRISLPAINSDQLLLEGSDSAHLRYGAGHVTGTALPGQPGNCCIAGHRNYTFGTYFSRLDELKTGDTAVIQSGGKDYVYRITGSLVVSPDEVSVLADPGDGRGMLTLITCHPKGSNTQRLILQGELI